MTANLHILVAGGSRGIGLALARLEYAAGHQVTILARPSSRLDKAVEEISRTGGGSVHPLGIDLMQPEAELFVRSRLANLPPLNRMYLVVGGGQIEPFASQTPPEFEATLDLNLKAPARVMRGSLDRLQDECRVVVLNSIAGLQPFAGWSAYCAAKAGLRALCDCWRQELVERKIRVLSAFPYATNTEFWDRVPGEWDRRRMMTAEQVATTVYNAVLQEVLVEEIRFASPHGRL